MRRLEINRLNREIELLDEHVVVDFSKDHRCIARRIGRHQSVHTILSNGSLLSIPGLGDQMSIVEIIKNNFDSRILIPGKILTVDNKMIKGLEELITIK